MRRVVSKKFMSEVKANSEKLMFTQPKQSRYQNEYTATFIVKQTEKATDLIKNLSHFSRLFLSLCLTNNKRHMIEVTHFQ